MALSSCGRATVFCRVSSRCFSAKRSTARYSPLNAVRVTSKQLGEFCQTLVEDDYVNFGVGQPNAEYLQRNITALVRDQGLLDLDPLALQYGSRRGPRSFLESIAECLTRHYGFPVDQSELMLTNGNSHALGFMLKHVLRGSRPEETTVLMDDPTYFLAANMVRHTGAQLKLVPVKDADGLDVDYLEENILSRHCSAAPIKALYMSSPWFHNPTGSVLSEERARRLCALAERHDFVILADEPYALMGFPGACQGTSLRRFDAAGDRVVSMGSFSKIVGPGLRLGWIHAGAQMIEERLSVDPVIDSGGGFNPFIAAMLQKALFSRAACFDALLQELNEVHARRATALAQALKQEFGAESIDVEEPRGGYFMWCRLRGRAAAVDTGRWRKWLMQPTHKEEFRVCFLFGQACTAFDSEEFRSDRFSSHFRCTWAFYKERELVEGARRLRVALDAYIQEGMP